MIPDPTTEIKRIRHELGAADNFDVERLFARIRRMEAQSDRVIIRRSPLRISDNAMHRSGEAARNNVENPSSPPGDR